MTDPWRGVTLAEIAESLQLAKDQGLGITPEKWAAVCEAIRREAERTAARKLASKNTPWKGRAKR